jgi:hypothetical protein
LYANTGTYRVQRRVGSRGLKIGRQGGGVETCDGVEMGMEGRRVPRNGKRACLVWVWVMVESSDGAQIAAYHVGSHLIIKLVCTGWMVCTVLRAFVTTPAVCAPWEMISVIGCAALGVDSRSKHGTRSRGWECRFSFHLPFTKTVTQLTRCLLDRILSLQYLAVVN